MHRRQFLQQGGTAALGLAFLPAFTRKAAASDRVRMAIVGVGQMGNNHLKWFAGLPDVEIVALCDVDADHLGQSLKTLSGLQPQHKAQGYSDFRKVLDRNDIDAISCATPDHWHAPIATLAFKAGKDVYGEKPLSYDVWEGQQMLKALNRHKRVFQMGTQIHAGDNYHRVVEIIRSGALGKVHTVRLWKTGAPPDLGPAQIGAPPPSLNWDMWLGPAPYADYTPQRCHFTYRYFLDYSGGVFADFWCHIADVVYWSLNPKGLKKISAKGEAPKGINDAPQWLDVDYEFDDLKLYWTHEVPDVPGAAGRGIGAYFEGDKGTLLCDYNSRLITINGETVPDLSNVSITLQRSPGHQQNFIDAVKSRTQPQSNLEYARQMTLPMHLGLISYRLGRPLAWNSKKERFINDDEANALLHREYRKGWDLL
ncbi:Gfo/Idh/MocA family protein [Pseudocnuella soli]|uniref:Gfo/Idh/MocA family protein n=1 Tax=Pseudocnuella soli TaxID=2502779 RepID=UPI00104C0F79|nr:Gfo/Idh/MocA family oxidoreductase [Pseudocnuella soli]